MPTIIITHWKKKQIFEVSEEKYELIKNIFK